MKSVVVPAYNEQARIEVALAWCLNLFDEVVVVCDGTDRTESIVRLHRVLDDRVVLVKSQVRLGKGGALLAGYKASCGDRVFFVDADVPVPGRYVPLFEQWLDTCDLVVASRYLPDSCIVMAAPLKRRIMSWGYRRLCESLFHNGTSDFQCGFKAFNREVLEVLRDRLVLTGWAFDLELILRAERFGFRVAEVPVEWSYGGDSKVSLKTSASMLREVWKLHNVLAQ